MDGGTQAARHTRPNDAWSSEAKRQAASYLVLAAWSRHVSTQVEDPWERARMERKARRHARTAHVYVRSALRSAGLIGADCP